MSSSMRQPSLRFLLASGVILVLGSTTASAAPFDDAWSVVQAGAYAKKPEYRTSLSSFFVRGVNVLAQSADRTLASHADTLLWFQKLVHPIGICFAGTWSITAASPYSGYFARGSTAKIIVRASEALGNSGAAGYRSLGFAGKIFANDGTAKTANFFTLDDLGGTLDAHFLDSPKTNHPVTSFHPSDLIIFPILLEIGKTFVLADFNPTVRQVYEIAELGLTDPATANTPGWFKVSADTTTRVAAGDFRDELRLSHYPHGLSFGIYAKSSAGDAWQRLGTISLDQEALSDGCDHRLHFHHPPAK